MYWTADVKSLQARPAALCMCAEHPSQLLSNSMMLNSQQWLLPGGHTLGRQACIHSARQLAVASVVSEPGSSCPADSSMLILQLDNLSHVCSAPGSQACCCPIALPPLGWPVPDWFGMPILQAALSCLLHRLLWQGHCWRSGMRSCRLTRSHGFCWQLCCRLRGMSLDSYAPLWAGRCCSLAAMGLHSGQQLSAASLLSGKLAPAVSRTPSNPQIHAFKRLQGKRPSSPGERAPPLSCPAFCAGPHGLQRTLWGGVPAWARAQARLSCWATLSCWVKLLGTLQQARLQVGFQ